MVTGQCLDAIFNNDDEDDDDDDDEDDGDDDDVVHGATGSGAASGPPSSLIVEVLFPKVFLSINASARVANLNFWSTASG